MYYYGARYYAAWLCRFVSVDPLQFKYPHYTPYQYAGNKPVSYIDLDGLEENKTIELNWKISEQIDARPELRVPMDEIWGIGRFGGLNLGIVSEKGIESKDGKYTIHGIESGPNKGNWLVREHYENGDYKNLVVAGTEAFKEVRSGKISERGTALNLIAAGEMLGADPTSTYRENILNGWKEAWTPENIVFSLLLAIAVIKTPLSGMARKVEVNAAKTSTTTVGRWMSKAEYEMMAKTGRMVEGAGGQTFVATGGPGAFNAAAKGSVYVEFQVPTSSLLQGGQANWFKVIGPNAGKAMQGALQKQGGQLLPQIQNLSPILQIK